MRSSRIVRGFQPRMALALRASPTRRSTSASRQYFGSATMMVRPVRLSTPLAPRPLPVARSPAPRRRLRRTRARSYSAQWRAHSRLLLLLQHHPHALDIFAGEAPIALRVKIADGERVRLAERHAGEAEGHLPGDEIASAQGALVIKQDAGTGEEAVGLAIVDDASMAEQLGDAIRTPRVERRLLVLRHRLRLAEHLRR
jgi:hypothetical protein